MWLLAIGSKPSLPVDCCCCQDLCKVDCCMHCIHCNIMGSVLPNHSHCLAWVWQTQKDAEEDEQNVQENVAMTCNDSQQTVPQLTNDFHAPLDMAKGEIQSPLAHYQILLFKDVGTLPTSNHDGPCTCCFDCNTKWPEPNAFWCQIHSHKGWQLLFQVHNKWHQQHDPILHQANNKNSERVQGRTVCHIMLWHGPLELGWWSWHAANLLNPKQLLC